MKRLALASFAACLQLISTSSAEAARLEILVPAYFYPGTGTNDWGRLTEAVASGVPVTAIMNPSSGPGATPNGDYVAAISAFRSAGGKVLGYVPSGYVGQQVSADSSCQPASGATYSPSDVVACASLYRSLYDVDGIFVDEKGPLTPTTAEADVLSFYQLVYHGIKAVDAAWEITGNPGTAASEALLWTGATGAADNLVTFENVGSEFASVGPPPYQAEYDASRFGALLIETDPGFDLENSLALASSRNFGQIYFTDDARPNPYDRLPSYWDEQVSAVKKFNAASAVPEPGSWMMLIAGFAALGFAMRRRPFLGKSKLVAVQRRDEQRSQVADRSVSGGLAA
ncbi:spherulation-specific family 4 protein [Glacieibacterium frigidum]|uniref:PEP-CTERM sorting domain-containing protein n=1 Tax=Glacieibacterium frigidum TaxID=2593303 RepID=A0A552U8F5_9SPHN|nr:spherulation-specific family 4 protein [Glacieibacterium frigidum]TRW14469.1 PEP-CTERM sorting domain-containing protein [Glacieibacterium frigidum]